MLALRRVTAKKSVIVGCVVLALILLALSIFLDVYFRENRPAQPEPTQGRVYATRLAKGVGVYLTHKEHTVYGLLMPSGIVSIVIGLLLNSLWKQFPPSKKRLIE